MQKVKDDCWCNNPTSVTSYLSVSQTHVSANLSSDICGFGWRFDAKIYTQPAISAKKHKWGRTASKPPRKCVELIFNPLLIANANFGNVTIEVKSNALADADETSHLYLPFKREWGKDPAVNLGIYDFAFQVFEITVTFPETLQLSFPSGPTNSKSSSDAPLASPEKLERITDHVMSGAELVDIKYYLFSRRTAKGITGARPLFACSQFLAGYLDYLDTQIKDAPVVNMDSDAHVIPETKLAQYYDYESDSDLEDEDDGLGSDSDLPESLYHSSPNPDVVDDPSDEVFSLPPTSEGPMPAFEELRVPPGFDFGNSPPGEAFGCPSPASEVAMSAFEEPPDFDFTKLQVESKESSPMISPKLGPISLFPVIQDPEDLQSALQESEINFESSKSTPRAVDEDWVQESNPLEPEDRSEKVSGCQGHRMGRVIPIENLAYRTWKALILYLFTGKISFADIGSKRNRAKWSCSPKSMYRLARVIQHKELEILSLQTIQKQLSVDNIVHEAFSTFTSWYEEIQQIEIKFFCENFSRIKFGEPELERVTKERRGLSALLLIMNKLAERQVPLATDNVPQAVSSSDEDEDDRPRNMPKTLKSKLQY